MTALFSIRMLPPIACIHTAGTLRWADID